MIELGRLEKEENLRAVWDTEDGSFTPWLAKDENLKLLGNTIGIDLELESKEEYIGQFRSDIVCKDTSSPTNNWVLIENQIEKTDHTHLGQILTYGAGLGATNIVWIAKQFTEDHRAALDWLNEITNDNFNFFGLEIELWRIGDSPIAPKFNVVCKPNGWIGAKSDRTDDNPDHLLRMNYWTKFIEFLTDQNSKLKTSKPTHGSWLTVSIGKSNAILGANAYLKEKRIAVSLSLSGRKAKHYFKSLQQQKEAIENEIGAKLEWKDSAPTNRSIILSKKDVDVRDTLDWPNQHKWLYENLNVFYKAFAQRIKDIDDIDYPSENTIDNSNEGSIA